MELTRIEIEAHIERARRLRSAAVGEIFSAFWQHTRNSASGLLMRLQRRIPAGASANFRTQD
jgi:hypothetical protein